MDGKTSWAVAAIVEIELEESGSGARKPQVSLTVLAGLE
jgi:hypothetical protein